MALRWILVVAVTLDTVELLWFHWWKGRRTDDWLIAIESYQSSFRWCETDVLATICRMYLDHHFSAGSHDTESGTDDSAGLRH